MSLPRHRAVYAAICCLCAAPGMVGAQVAADASGVSIPGRFHTLAQLGFPNGLSLDGSNAEQVISFRLPPGAHLDSARLHLEIHFSRTSLPESNLQVYANDVRLAVVGRSEADSAGASAVDVSV